MAAIVVRDRATSPVRACDVVVGISRHPAQVSCRAGLPFPPPWSYEEERTELASAVSTLSPTAAIVPAATLVIQQQARGAAALRDARRAPARRAPPGGADRAHRVVVVLAPRPARARRPPSPPRSTCSTPDRLAHDRHARRRPGPPADLPRGVAGDASRRSVRGVVTSALAAGPRPRRGGRAAGRRPRRAQPIVLVLDDLERLGDAREPWELIDSFLRHGHSSLRRGAHQPPRPPAAGCRRCGRRPARWPRSATRT